MCSRVASDSSPAPARSAAASARSYSDRGFVEPSAVLEEHRQRVHRRHDVLVVRTERGLAERDRLAKPRLGVVVSAADAQDVAERRSAIARRAGRCPRCRPPRPPPCRTRRMTSTDRPAGRLGGRIVRALLVHARQAVEHVGDIGMAVARFLLEQAERLAGERVPHDRTRRPPSREARRRGVHGPRRDRRRRCSSVLEEEMPVGFVQLGVTAIRSSSASPPCSSISAEATSAFDTATDSTPARRMRAAASASSRRTPETK